MKGHRLNVLLTILSVLSLVGVVAAKQQDQVAQTLSPGVPIERQLSGGQTHVYRVSLSAGQFAVVEVDQRGIDLVLTAIQPDNKVFASINLRQFAEGVEPLVILADAPGDYTFKVTPWNPKAAGAKYEARLSEVRVANDQDRLRAKAQALSYQGQVLSLETASESKRRAIQVYEEAVVLWRQLNDPWWESLLLLRQGRVSINLTEFSQAKDYFGHALVAKRAMGDRRGEASAHSGICESLHFMGDMKAKATCLDSLILIQRELGNRLEIGKALSNKATTFNSLGDFQSALQTAQEALGIFEAENDPVQVSFALNTLGQIYRSLNEQQLALDHYERALALRRAGSDKGTLSVTIGDIGVTYYELGDFQRAIDYLSQSVAISNEIGDRRTKAIRLHGLALIWKRTDEIDKALNAENESLALVRQVGDRQSEGSGLIGLGTLYEAKGNTEKARDLFTQGLELSRQTGDAVTEATALKELGRLMIGNGNHGEAIKLLQQSLSVAQRMNHIESVRNALLNLAQAERARNNLSEARRYHELSLALTESLRTKILAPELRATYLAQRQGEYEQYIDVLMQLDQQQPSAGYALTAFEISERGRARSLLETLTEAHAKIREGVDLRLLEQERTLGDLIRIKERERSQLYGNTKTAKQTEDLAKEIDELLNQYQDLESRIRAVSPRYAALTQPQPLSVREVQASFLDTQTVLLEFALGDERSWLWAITPDSVDTYSLPARSQIEAQASKVYELLTYRQLKPKEVGAERDRTIAAADVRLANELQALSQTLLGGITNKLSNEWNNRRLLIVAGGALEYLPFAALISSASKQPLIADHEVVRLPSASVLATIRQDASTRNKAARVVAVLADPVFDTNDPRVLMAQKTRGRVNEIATRSSVENRSDDGVKESALQRSVGNIYEGTGRVGLSRLPFSREEATAVASLVSPSLVLKATDFRASRATATSGELSNYRLVHFATHGLLNSVHPELSGLVLSLVDENGKTQDGFLRMNEIYNLRLSAEVVVLSACQTGLGKEIKGEGLVGLTRGFMYAGAQRVVASLWQVDDLATSQLMKRFYRGLLKDGLRPAAALRAAQLELMRDKRWSSPYFWAPFVIQGEWK